MHPTVRGKVHEVDTTCGLSLRGKSVFGSAWGIVLSPLPPFDVRTLSLPYRSTKRSRTRSLAAASRPLRPVC
jgi:hypothetical protein